MAKETIPSTNVGLERGIHERLRRYWQKTGVAMKRLATDAIRKELDRLEKPKSKTQ